MLGEGAVTSQGMHIGHEVFGTVAAGIDKDDLTLSVFNDGFEERYLEIAPNQAAAFC